MNLSNKNVHVGFSKEDIEKGSSILEQFNVIETLKTSFKNPPDEKILPYLCLNFTDFDKLKTLHVLKINPPFKIFEDQDSFSLGYIDSTFGWGSKKNYILNLAYQDVYFNFYTAAEKKKILTKDDELYDVIGRVNTLSYSTNRYSDFPFYDLIGALNLFD